MLSYQVKNLEEKNALEGLAYWIADSKYIAERFGADDPELERSHLTIKDCFDSLDRLGVPYWVQNAAVAFAENWRRYKSEYMDSWMLKNRNVNMHPAM